MALRPAFPRIIPTSPLGRGLVFAALGGGYGTTTAFDATLHGNDGTLTSMDPPTDWVWSTELGRRALDFDGTSDHVLFPELALQPPISFSVWIRPTAIDRYCIAIATGDFGRVNNTNYGAAIQLRVDGGLGVEYGDGGTQVVGNRRLKYSAASLYAANEWTHLAGVIHSLGNDMSLYCNGVDVGGSYSGIHVGAIAYSGTNGAVGWGDRTYCVGEISDTLIWNRILTPYEVRALADKSNTLLTCGGQDAIWTPGLKTYSYATAGGANEYDETGREATAAGATSGTDIATYVDSLGASAAGSVSGTNLATFVDSLDAEAVGAASSTDVAAYTASLDTEAAGATSGTDVAAYTDSLDAEAAGATSGTDLAAYTASLTATAAGTATLTDIGTFTDSLTATAAGTTSGSDVYSGAGFLAAWYLTMKAKR